jgi:hypothetical protein
MTELPDTLSGLLELALNDLRKCESDPRFKINMWRYYMIDTSEDVEQVCHVCLAGAVMAGTLGYTIADLQSDPLNDPSVKCLLPENTPFESKLMALDFLRRGHVGYAIAAMKHGAIKYVHNLTTVSHDRSVTPYEDDKCQWHEDMALLLKHLKEVGL